METVGALLIGMLLGSFGTWLLIGRVPAQRPLVQVENIYTLLNRRSGNKRTS